MTLLKTNHSIHDEEVSLSSNNNKNKMLFEMWSKHEEIAMHFNELLIKLRVQALGSIAISGTVVASFIEGNNPESIKVLPVFFLFSWIAIFCLDMYYYNILLESAVKAIEEIERKSDGFLLPMKLSTIATEKVESSKFNGRVLFYSIIFMFLLLSSLIAWRQEIVYVFQCLYDLFSIAKS